jgi:hypothetical protein
VRDGVKASPCLAGVSPAGRPLYLSHTENVWHSWVKNVYVTSSWR